MSRERGGAGRRLVLLRHAKAVAADTRAADRDRPLERRGEKAARALAAWFAAREAPDLVLCSAALRTRQTLDHLLPAFAAPPQVSVEERLYLATAGTLLVRLSEVPDAVGAVLMIGHNPGLHELALALAGPGRTGRRARLAAAFPTGALAAYRFAGSWRDIARLGLHLDQLLAPADLAASGDG